jgi:hypothetical protein
VVVSWFWLLGFDGLPLMDVSCVELWLDLQKEGTPKILRELLQLFCFAHLNMRTMRAICFREIMPETDCWETLL